MKLRDLFKTERIIRVDPEETLASALSLLESSHDAAFVFKNDKLEGVINPYYCLIKKSYPGNTKVKTCLVKPPHLDISDPIDKAARLMVESKIHFLPVFEKDKFTGIVSARRILAHIKTDDRFKKTLENKMLKGRKLITAKESMYLSKALAEFKKHKISKLLIVSNTDHVEGILTYYDLINHLSMPVERQNFASRSGDKHPLLKKPVKNFLHKNVITLASKKTYRDVIDAVLEKEVGSVVITDDKKAPVGIVTMSDILREYADKSRLSSVTRTSSGLSRGSETLVQLFTRRFNSMMRRRTDVDKIEVKVIEKKQGGVFRVVVSVFQHGKRMLVSEEGKNLQSLLKDMKQKARRLLSK